MSGHSHFKNIKRIKEANEKRRSQIFSKMARLITVAIREGGSNPETNPKLRMAIQRAREFNVPKENIERIIKQVSGKREEKNLEGVLFEAYGPGQVAIIIEGVTDNKNRSLGEIKHILAQHQGKLAAEGAVRWMFDRKGCLTINLAESGFKNKEELELAGIEAGADDIYWRGDILEVYTKVEELEKVKKNLEERGVKIKSFSLDWVPKEEISISEKDKITSQKLFEALDENETVQNIYSNLKYDNNGN